MKIVYCVTNAGTNLMQPNHSIQAAMATDD